MRFPSNTKRSWGGRKTADLRSNLRLTKSPAGVVGIRRIVDPLSDLQNPKLVCLLDGFGAVVDVELAVDGFDMVAHGVQ